MATDKEERIANAISEAKSSGNQAAAARNWDIPPSTLSNRIKTTSESHKAQELNQRLFVRQEFELERWIFHEELYGRSPFKALVHLMAQEIVSVIGNREILGIY
jgi:hypothetical protein